MLAPLLAVAEREPWIAALAAALAVDGRVLARLGEDGSRPRQAWTGPGSWPVSTGCRTYCATRASRGLAQMSSASRAAARAAPSVSTGR